MNGSGRPGSRKGRLKLLAFLVLAGAVVVASKIGPLSGQLSWESVSARLDRLEEICRLPYGPPLFVLVSAGLVLLHLPQTPMILLGGTVYPFGEALFYCWLGCGIGTSLSFLVARYFLREFLRPRLRRSVFRRLDDRLERDGLAVMFGLRAILFMFPPLNWLMGATGIRIRDYLVGNALGLLPQLVLFLLAVSRFGSVRSLRELVRGGNVLLALILVVVLGAALVVRRRIGASRAGGAPAPDTSQGSSPEF